MTGIALLMPASRRVNAKYVRAYLGKRVASTTTTRMRVDLGGGQFFERRDPPRRRVARPERDRREGEVVEERRASDREARDLPR